jgi:2,5-diketo-D-gluconate reductase B
MNMPRFGLGTWRLNGKECEEAVESALEIGYRLIDTAHLYGNHKEIGRALESIPRSRVFLSSKFALTDLDNFVVEKSCNEALLELGTDYLDLFSLHYPDRKAPMEKVLLELEALKKKEKVRHIGVCNFTIRHLQDMLKMGIKPYANQVEFHPYLYQKELLDFCKQEGIQLVAYRSLGKGALLQDPLIEEIAEKYEKTPAQLLLRWCLDKGVYVIPKASSREHLEENLQLFDFALSVSDQLKLDSLPERRFCVGDWSDFDYL